MAIKHDRATRRGVRPQHKNEVWYRARLRKIVKDARADIEPQLRKFLHASLTPENQGLSHHIAVTARNMVHSAKQSFEMTGKPLAISTAAARMNLDSVDQQIQAQAKRVLGYPLPLRKADIPLRKIAESVRVPVRGDAEPQEFPTISFKATHPLTEVIKTQIGNNVRLINSIPSQYYDRLAKDMYEGITEASEWEGLADRMIATLVDDAGITQRRADLIARDQTAKMTAAFNEQRQTSVGIQSYQWLTMEDERVRETHAENDGKVFDWDSPPEETGHPGNDVNCRCTALAQFAEIGETNDEEE